MLVLLVEDHDDTRDATVLCLEAAGLSVETAITGLQAIAKTSRVKPEVIVMDLGLPGMDGWEAARRLKADPETRLIPIIALSAHAMPIDEASAVDAGCDAYLRKPCTPDTLIAAIRRVKAS